MASTLLTIRTSSPISQVNFIILIPTSHKPALQRGPIPQCYGASQALADALLYAGSNGIVYPSIRHSSGTCIACFRPALVFHPRRGQEYRIRSDLEQTRYLFEQVIHPL